MLNDYFSLSYPLMPVEEVYLPRCYRSLALECNGDSVPVLLQAPLDTASAYLLFLLAAPHSLRNLS